MNNYGNMDNFNNGLFIGDKIKFIAKCIAKNEINDKKYINIFLFMLVNIFVSLIIVDIVKYWNTMRYKFLYYQEILIANLIMAELIILIRLLVQLINIPYELISKSNKYKYKLLHKGQFYLHIVYIATLSILIVHDFDFDDNTNINSSLRKFFVLAITLIFICYDTYEKKSIKKIEEKYLNDDDEIINKYIECFQNLLEFANFGLNIKGIFMIYQNYLMNERGLEEQIDECIICMENFENHDKILKTICNHIYHRKCIVKWMLQNRNCPICRKKLY
jgi:hypothetical protein